LKETTALAEGTILFYKGKFQKANRLLSTTSFKNQKIKNGARLLKVMIDFESEEDIDYLHSSLSNFSSYIRRLQKETSYTAGAKNLISLLRLSLKNGRKSITQETLSQTTPLIRRLWLKKYVK